MKKMQEKISQLEAQIESVERTNSNPREPNYNQDRIKQLEDKLAGMERSNSNLRESLPTRQSDQTPKDREGEKAPRKNIKPIKLTPALNLDWDGNQAGPPEDSQRMEPKQYYWTEVRLPKRRWEQRPRMSDTMNEDVQNQYEKHMQEKYRGDNVQHTKSQKPMTPDLRKKIIQDMLIKSGQWVGIGPITKEHIKSVEKILTNRGSIPKN